MKKSLLVCATAVCLPMTAGVQAAPSAGDRELMIQGTGTSDDSFDANVFSASVTYGWYTTDYSMWGIRQSASVADTNDTSADWNGATRVFYDYHFGDTAWRPYVGASLGYLYGETTNETFSAGPELGVKYYVKEDTFVGLSAEYQFLFDDSDDIDDSYDDGAIFYGLGVGFNF